MATEHGKCLVTTKKALNCTIKYSERERETTFMYFLFYYYCCEFLTVPNLQIKLYCRYVCIGKIMVCEWFATICSFRYPLGFWNKSSAGKREVLC